MINELVNAIKGLFPVDGNRQSLVLRKIWVEPVQTTPSKLKSLKMRDATYGSKLYGEFELRAKSGELIDRDNVYLGVIPEQTPHHTFIINGKEYQASKTLRLKPAAYSRIKDDGDIETAFNLGKGYNFKMFLDKSHKMWVEQGTNKIKLFPFMRLLGISDDEAKESLGQKLYDKNFIPRQMDRAVWDKLYRLIIKKDPSKLNDQQVKSVLRAYYKNGTYMDPEANKRLLGTPYSSIYKDIIKDVIKKQIGLYKGTVKPDQRDDIPFKYVTDIYDIAAETINYSPMKITGKLRYYVDRAKSLSDLDIRSKISSTIKSVFVNARVSQTPETTNILDIISNDSKLTLAGDGGLGSDHVVTMQAREVNPSAMGFIDPVKTNTAKVGVIVHQAIGAKINDKKEFETFVYDLKNHKYKYINANEHYDNYVAFPGEYIQKDGKYVPRGKHIYVVYGGEMKVVSPRKVRYIIPDPRLMYSDASNVLPFLHNNAGIRATYASNQYTQAVPLKYREEPMVAVKAEGGKTAEGVIARAFLSKSPVDGIVTSVTNDKVKIKNKAGETSTVELYKNYQLNQGAFIDENPIVKPGDKVKSGQPIVESNYTKNGKLALGQNLVFAFMPYKGYTYEDGVVISDKAAKKLTSEHLYTFEYRYDGKKNALNYNLFSIRYGSRYPLSKRNKLDKDGVVKQGEEVNSGDILVAGLKHRVVLPEERLLKIRKGITDWVPDIISYDHDVGGKVIEVEKTRGKVYISIKTEEKMKIGDKISARDGAKGVVTNILPEDMMPEREDGKSIDIIMDPHGLPSRMNVGQNYEAILGKISEKIKKPVVVENFNGENTYDMIKRMAKAAGITDKESVYDPETGEISKGITVGRKYIVKLKHKADKKLGARNPRIGSFTIEGIPIHGQKIDRYTRYALLAHGAKANLAEMATYKAENNPDLWMAIQYNEPLPPPKPTQSYEKFIGLLKSMNVNVKKEGRELVMSPLTDSEVSKISSGEIRSAHTYRAKDMQPIPGGLFDLKITGGIGLAGKKWSHILLPVKMVNPIFAPAISIILNIPQNRLERIIKGDEEYHGKTGSEAIESALKAIDVNLEIQKTEKASVGTKQTARDRINRKLRYLKALKKLGLTPSEAYMVKKIPVLPPEMRPVIELPGNQIIQNDMNLLYRDMLLTSKNAYEDAVTKEDKKKVVSNIYDAYKALEGKGQPLTRGKKISGALNIISPKGKQAKQGYFQSKVMARPQELSGRAVITVGADLGVDEVGLPKNMAMKLYEPFIFANLRKRGIPPKDIMKHIKSQTMLAQSALEQESRNRPVLINRAPSWYKLNIVAAKPRIIDGDAMAVPNLPVGPYFGGDYDGDTMAVHIPITDKAVREAMTMFPSKFLYKPGTKSLLIKPDGSAMVGIYEMLQITKPKQSRSFDTLEKAKYAEAKNIIKVSDEITILGKKTTLGRELLNKALPEDMQIKYKGSMTRADLNKLFDELSIKYPNDYANIVNELRKIGDEYSTYIGFTIGMDDLKPLSKERDEIINPILDDIAKYRGNDAESYAVKKIKGAEKKFEAALPKVMSKSNNLYKMMTSGSKGKPDQIRQIVGFGGLYPSISHINTVPVVHSFSEGLSPAEYYVQQMGSRYGLAQRTLGTSKPGEIGNIIEAANNDTIITMHDCGTYDGLLYRVDDVDAVTDRALAEDVVIDGKTYAKRNEFVTLALQSALAKVAASAKKINFKIKVRSPLTCVAPKGLCQMCYGLNDDGQLPQIGDAVGLNDTEALLERSANLTLKAFHNLGSQANQISISDIDRYKQLIEFPKNLRGKAVIATASGMIEHISKPNELGEITIRISGNEYVIPPNIKLLPNIRIGRPVQKGETLTTGLVKPQELVSLTGMLGTQRQIVDDMSKIFAPHGIKRKALETTVAGYTGNGVITDPGDSPFNLYDMSKINEIEDYNRVKEEKIPIEEALERILAKDYKGYKSGEEVTKLMIADLKIKGVNDVVVQRRPAQYQNLLLPASVTVDKQPDWLRKLDYIHLKKNIADSAAAAARADLHGTSPIPGWAYGAEFGSGVFY